MKSFCIITGGILAIVLLAPNQKRASAKAEASILNPNDEIDAVILAQDGPDVSQEWADIRREEIATDLAREKAEMRKYGRVLTDVERFQKEVEAETEAQRGAAAAFYAERKEWIDNFPFQSHYHQNIVYDPQNIAHNDEKYHAYRKELERKSSKLWHEMPDRRAEIWARTDLIREEKQAASRKLEQEMEDARKLDPEIEAERRIIERHKQLAGFYAQKYRYLPEFEQAYRIFEEEGLADNPIRIAHTMVGLENYFVSSKQDPDELHPVQTREVDPPPLPQGQFFQGKHGGIFAPQGSISERKPSPRRRITWGEHLETNYRCIAGNMASQRNLIPGEKNLTEEQINRIRDSLVAEIPADNFNSSLFNIGMLNPKDEDLVPGQSLLAR